MLQQIICYFRAYGLYLIIVPVYFRKILRFIDKVLPLPTSDGAASK